jgi:cobalt-precorrin 5A hydrolase
MTPARRPFAIYAITRHGIASATRLREALPGADLFVSQKLASLAPSNARPFAASDGAVARRHVHRVRLRTSSSSASAPSSGWSRRLLVNKKVDPAVICVDDAARFSICVLSGHVGRGNLFTERVAAILGAPPS